MVVHYFYLVSVCTYPAEANPPLVIDTDTVLSFTVGLQGLQMVALRSAQIAQMPSLVQKQQFTPCDPLDLCRQPF